jgi:predicted transcriptional regulator
MDDLDIRLAMIKPLVRQRIKELAISSGDDDLMFYISLGSNTSAKIAAETGSSIPSVSARLSKLRDKGYIVRKEVMQASGGYEYVYRNIFNFAEDKAGAA